MKSNSPTEVGQNKPQPNDIVDALNQVFALFQLNYHNQYFKAFGDEKNIIVLKKVWKESLKEHSASTLLDAAKSIIKTSEFLPTLKTMLDHCEKMAMNTMPLARAAYVEACCAASPKVEQAWSHPAVYLAGKQVGWHFLQSNSENIAFPAFKAAYEALIERARTGESLVIEKPIAIDAPEHVPASKSTSQKYIRDLQDLLKD